MKQYVFDRFSEEARRLINQTGVKAKMIEKEGNEVFNAVTVSDNISQISHIIGGICGAVLGFTLRGRR